ncbi:hypothetical protein P9139_05425 [Curtobacterium flaccumfaciens]|nr:hypothetical protein P9139_05425 [Curtobacterium flaccumfaciens]
MSCSLSPLWGSLRAFVTASPGSTLITRKVSTYASRTTTRACATRSSA